MMLPGPALHSALTWLQIALAVITVVAVLFIRAPYGRHLRAGWGPQIPARLGWIVMESPAVVFFLLLYAQGAHRAEVVPLVFLVLWQVHYVHRSFVFPFRMRITGKRMPVLVALLAIAFNLLNATINATWIAELGAYPVSWLWDPRFVIGTVVFCAGFGINFWADRVLLALRAPGETGYKIPQGGLYRLVSCPNYLGEILEWTGFAIACWSLPGLAFALYTAANVGPRALANHRWYRDTFPEYPPERRALVPFLL